MDTIEDIDISIESLLDEVARIQDRIRDLRTRRNSLMPIYRLPPELLIRIFYFYQDSDIIQEKEIIFSLPARCFPAVNWVRVTFVCRHFRDTALKERGLWSSIDLGWPIELIHACVERSEENYLNLSAARRAKLVSQYVSKARALQLLGYSVSDTSETLSHPLPNLRWLKYMPTSRFTFDESFLGGACDLLTTLQIYNLNCYGPKTIPKFRSLRELVLINLTLVGGMQTWDKLLGSTPALQSLTVMLITIYDLNDIGKVEDTSERISLPALHTFNIEGDAFYVGLCLRSVSEPAHHLMISLSDKMLAPGHLVYYEEAFERICSFWKNKTGHASPPPGRFTYISRTFHSHFLDPYVQFESPDRGDASPAVLFKATADVDHAFSFWPHVRTLVLEERGSSEILLDDNFSRLSGLRSIYINIPSQLHDEISVRKWVSRQESSDGVSTVNVYFSRNYPDGWMDFLEEMKDHVSGIQWHWGSETE
jgi:hypothetical protein